MVELFPAKAPLPNDLAEVMNRCGQLLFASKLKIDRKLFRTIGGIINFLQKIEPHIPQQFRDDPAYREIFTKHRKIDALTVIPLNFRQLRITQQTFRARPSARGIS